MSQPLVIAGAHCRLFLNNTIYSVTQSVSVETNTGEYEIFGINAMAPQEIAGGGQSSAKGSVQGIRIHRSGGLQGSNALSLVQDRAASNYVSLRLEDRLSGETLWSIPKAKITGTSDISVTKAVYKLNFTFVGQIIYWPLDLS